MSLSSARGVGASRAAPPAALKRLQPGASSFTSRSSRVARRALWGARAVLSRTRGELHSRLSVRAQSKDKSESSAREGWGPGGQTWFTEEDAREQKLLGELGVYLLCMAACFSRAIPPVFFRLSCPHLTWFALVLLLSSEARAEILLWVSLPRARPVCTPPAHLRAGLGAPLAGKVAQLTPPFLTPC